MTVQTSGFEVRNTLHGLQRLQDKVARHNGNGVTARICGATMKDGRSVRITSCQPLRRSSGATRFKFVVKMKDAQGKAIKWSGWSDDIEITELDDCIVLVSPNEPPLKVY